MGEFDEFEEESKTVEPAKAGAAIGRLPVGTYRGVCTMVDREDDGNMVDKAFIGGGEKTKGMIIFLEILEPEKVGDVDVKGEIHEHVFWVTSAMLPYIKRDAGTILGVDPASLTMNKIAAATFAGRPVEFGLKDETYQGITRSKVSFFNAWDPKAPKKEESKSKAKTSAGAKKETVKAETAGAPKKPVDF